MPKSVVMEEDIPENHPDGYLPILDCKMKIEVIDGINVIRYKFYKKPMATSEVTWRRSALPIKSKIDILTNDLVRRLRNCDRLCEREEIEEIISDYSKSLWFGGHSQNFRHTVCVKAVQNIETSIKNDREGIRRMYRNRSEVEERWKMEGGRPDTSTWFRKGGVTGILRVPSSNNERIKRAVEKVLREIPGPSGQYIKVLERPGPSIRASVMKNDPFPKNNCNRNNCPLTNSSTDGSCKMKCYLEGANYTVTCRECFNNYNAGKNNELPKTYIGESHRSVFTRINGHIQDLKSSMKYNGKKSWMAEHLREAHNGIFNSNNPVQDWLVTLRGTHRKPLDRQVTEFIDIRKVRTRGKAAILGKDREVSREIFNSKEEWYSHTSQWGTVV